MLRTSLRSVSLLGGRPIAAAAGRQWPGAASRQTSLVLGKRTYADLPKPPIIPPSETRSSERKPPATEDDVGESKAAIDPQNVPLSPPKPPPVKDTKPQPTATIDDVGESSVNASAATPPPPSPPPKKSILRRLRNIFFTMVILPILLFGGGVWYARVNDNFHDFFTEYVPFGEQAVLYLEENEFKKKFPHAVGRSNKPKNPDQPIRIPAKSGASWRVADSGEPTGRQSSSAQSSSKSSAQPSPKQPDEPRKAASPPPPAAEAPAPVKAQEKATPQPSEAPKPKSDASAAGFKAPEVNEPSRFPPLQPIDLMQLPDAKQPVVQDLVHMLNDLILVINADNAHGKYSTSIAKAKSEILKVGSKLTEMKKAIEKNAAGEVRTRVGEFDKAAGELIERVEKAMVTQEMQWREEFESEMTKVRESYDGRVKLLMERADKLNEEKLQNQLLEQAVALQKEFAKDLKQHVEQEREGRLGKLEELSKSVSDLEKITIGWNDVVDSNLRTQQLHVAIEAVRANIEDSLHPRPFIKELVALKEIAHDDEVVDAAIASVNPSAYQRGISSSSQLIDRFRRVASEVRKASLLPDEAGVASHASSWVLSHIMFKKEGLAEGSDVESILTRTQTYLEEGDLDSAAREMNGLEGWAKTLSKDWLGEVRKALEVQQALDVISTEARLQSLRVD